MKDFTRVLDDGETLIEAKKLVKVGGWVHWLKTESGMSPTTAEVHMRLAAHRKKIESYISGNAAGLSIRGALHLIRTGRHKRQAQAWPCACGDHWWAKLTRGFITMVSPQDAELIQNQVWTARPSESKLVVYAHKKVPAKKSTICLHQEILPGAIEVDHWNLNGLDNRRQNLRAADRPLNRANRNKATIANPSSPFKGVSYHPDRCFPWHVRCGGKYIGAFTAEIEAARAYDNAARELYGQFARANFAPEK